MEATWSNFYFGIALALTAKNNSKPPPPPPTGGYPAAKAANDDHYTYLKVAA